MPSPECCLFDRARADNRPGASELATVLVVRKKDDHNKKN